MFFFIMQTDKLPIQMGPAGTLLMFVLALVLAGLNAYQWKKSGEAKHWEGACKAYESELGIVRQRCERLESTNETLAQDNAVLRSRTDLESLKSQAAAIERALAIQTEQIQQTHAATLKGLEQLASVVGDMHERFLARDQENSGLIQAQSDLIKSLQSQVNLRAALG